MNKYDDIINLEHFEPKFHKRMSMESRAAQFAPFDALTGYSDAVIETARLTDTKHELDEETQNNINIKLQLIEEDIKSKPLIKVKYFIPDKKKNGGKYITYSGNVRRIDRVNEEIVFTNEKKINFNTVSDIIIEEGNM